MRKALGLIVSLIMILSAVGCMDNKDSLLPTNPNNFNSESNTGEDSKILLSDNSTEIEDSESSENDSDLGEEDNSSSNKNENESSNKTGGWTGFY